ncbi:hypothetical protein GOB25_30510 [Sinorhizobium meliloti]|nr:hypothetical protein [Sinorhizobium meliloti]
MRIPSRSWPQRYAVEARLARGGLYDPRNENDACGVGFVAHSRVRSRIRPARRPLHARKPDPPRRGRCRSADGDGAGILVQIPDRFFREEMAKEGVTLLKVGEYAVGYLFMPLAGSYTTPWEYVMPS